MYTTNSENKTKKHKTSVDVQLLLGNLFAYVSGSAEQAVKARNEIFLQLFEIIECWARKEIHTQRETDDEIIRSTVTMQTIENLLRKAEKYIGYGENIMGALRSTVMRFAASALGRKYRRPKNAADDEMANRPYQTADIDALSNMLNDPDSPYSYEALVDSVDKQDMQKAIYRAISTCKVEVKKFFDYYYGERAYSMDTIAKLMGYKSVQSVSNLKAKLLQVVGDALIREGYFMPEQRNDSFVIRRNNRTEKALPRQKSA